MMSDPIEFTYTSARHALPFLFQGQAQKEFFVNEALARLDALSHMDVLGSASEAPASAAEGECFIVGTAATGAWSGQDGKIASYQSGTWLFLQPVEGMHAFDRSTGSFVLFDGIWKSASAVSDPSGGTTIDAEARNAISALIASLVETGILPSA